MSLPFKAPWDPPFRHYVAKRTEPPEFVYIKYSHIQGNFPKISQLSWQPTSPRPSRLQLNPKPYRTSNAIIQAEKFGVIKSPETNDRYDVLETESYTDNELPLSPERGARPNRRNSVPLGTVVRGVPDDVLNSCSVRAIARGGTNRESESRWWCEKKSSGLWWSDVCVDKRRCSWLPRTGPSTGRGSSRKLGRATPPTIWLTSGRNWQVIWGGAIWLFGQGERLGSE